MPSEARAALREACACALLMLMRVTCAGWPRSFEWWLLNITGMILMAVLGCGCSPQRSRAARSPRDVLREWLCLRKEMRDIPLVRRVLLT